MLYIFQSRKQSLQISNLPKTLEGGLLTTKVDSPSQLAAPQQDMLEIRQWDLFEAQGGIRLLKSIVLLGGRMRDLELRIVTARRGWICTKNKSPFEFHRSLSLSYFQLLFYLLKQLNLH